MLVASITTTFVCSSIDASIVVLTIDSTCLLTCASTSSTAIADNVDVDVVVKDVVSKLRHVAVGQF